MRKVVFFPALLLLAFLVGCSSTPHYYEPDPMVEWTFRPGQSLVVIAGFSDMMSVRFADGLTEMLSETSCFTVMDQREVTAVFPEYPANILDSRTSFSESDIPKFQRIQQRLGTDYILVAWSPARARSSTNNVYNSFTAGFRTQLLGFPGAHRLGWSAFSESIGQAWSRQQRENESAVVQAGVEKMVSELLQKTGMQK